MSRLMKKVAKEAQRGVQKQVFKKYFLRDEKLVHMTQLKELYAFEKVSVAGFIHSHLKWWSDHNTQISRGTGSYGWIWNRRFCPEFIRQIC